MPRKRKGKKKRPQLMAPAGPPLNLRPGGAHKSQKDYDRKRQKAALRKEIELEV